MKNWIKQAILYFIMSIVSTAVALITQNIIAKIQKVEQRVEILIEERK